jgi:amino acid transporter
MPAIAAPLKRVLVGTPQSSERLGHTLLPKKIALPVFASDAMSSVAYATQEILIMLALGGAALFSSTPYIAGAVALLMVVVVASYRQNVRAYPSGGGDYEVATVNLGRYAGLTVASALMVDYVLTVAVSVSSGVDNITSAASSLQGHQVELCVGIIATITLMNLRGVRESGTAFAIPTYAFIVAVLGMVVLGLGKIATGSDLVAESARYDVRATHSFAGLGLAFLMLRAFASGCTALTGVEAISNGVPAFKEPKPQNAATTLALLGAIAITMFSGVTALALLTDVHVADPSTGATLVGFPAGQEQRTVIAQIGAAVFGGHSSPGFYFLQTVTALVLVLAANTAFNGFPVLGSILARDGYLPRQLHTRGDRLAYSNGIVLLAGFACLLIVAFDASSTRLIQLYIVGVFVSFTLSQTGMIRHWNRHLAVETDPASRGRMMRARVINTIGAVFTGTVLVIVLVTKFAHGAYIVVFAMPVIFLTMVAIRRHYDRVRQELAPGDEDMVLPSRIHAIVLVSKIHKPTLQAVNFARATRPSTLEAVTVQVDPEDSAALQTEWERRGIPVPLKVLDSPYREVTSSVVDYVKRVRRESPRDVVIVYIPEYVVGHWWESLLHNQSALRLKTRLLFTPGVMVTSVPWQLHSSTHRALDGEAPAPGQSRRLGAVRAAPRDEGAA